MIKILAIGNSFSQDATVYLHDIATRGGINTKVVNLRIGGCSLYTHCKNIDGDLPNYNCFINGTEMDRLVAIKETLLSDDWDFVTIQQASYDSGRSESYYPYAIQLSDYIKKYSPNAKQLIHQTWAYELDSKHDHFVKYEKSQEVMYKALKDAYQKLSDTLNLEIIPCGDVIQALRQTEQFDYSNNKQSLCRDGFHMHLIYGRYAVAATWFETILNGNILENDYMPPDVTDDDIELLEVVKTTVHNFCRKV